jgi:hypothetical protein
MLFALALMIYYVRYPEETIDQLRDEVLQCHGWSSVDKKRTVSKN